MGRKKLLLLIFCVGNVLSCCGAVEAASAQNLHNNAAVDNFQNALQQQGFYTILNSIEERLRNLDNVYSMQLSQTLETKLDQYNRKLDVLDSKIIRLEALVMLNLDKISENISTKNFKDDVTKTNMFRKVDTVYEGVIHRLGYMDRKFETNLIKVQNKIDMALNRLEKIEETTTTRESDIEAELADAIFAIDDLKTTCNTMESKLINITKSAYNITRDTYNALIHVNMESRKAMNRLHDNIIETMKYMDNKTSKHLKISNDNNAMLKTMKVELKEDFNDYANKVADMNSDIWKSSDTTEDDLKMIATTLNSTKVDIQNGVRSLMLQIGKLSNKNIITTDSNTCDEINKKLNTNFEKILSNQHLFLESCHRLQMDESQIESEISVMLEKLIDILEKKMSTETKDIKNLEKFLKSHDSRINRSIHEANTNIITLYEKNTKHDQDLKNEVGKVGNTLDALFSFVQGITNDGKTSGINLMGLLSKMNTIETYTKFIIRNQSEIIQLITNIEDQIFQQKLYTSLHVNNSSCVHTETTVDKNNTTLNKTNILNPEEETDKYIRKAVVEIYGTNSNLTNSNNQLNSINKATRTTNKRQENNQKLTQEVIKQIKQERHKKIPFKYMYNINIQNSLNPTEATEYEDSEENTTDNLEIWADGTDVTTETTHTNDDDVLEIEPNET